MEALLGPFSVRSPDRDGAVRASRHSFGRRTRDARVRERANARDVRRRRGAQHGAARAGSATSGYALGLIIAAHAVGWPVSRGGAQQLANALVAYLRSLGGEVVTDTPVESLARCRRRAWCCSTSRRASSSRIAGDRAVAVLSVAPDAISLRPGRVQDGLGAQRAGAVARAASAVAPGRCTSAARSRRSRHRSAQRGRDVTATAPTCCVTQPSVFDPTRAPAGKHTLWAYCHVPNGSTDRHARAHRAADRAVRARVSRLRRARRTSCRRRIWSAATRISSAATSPAARRISRNSTRVRSRASIRIGHRSATCFCARRRRRRASGVHGMSGYHAARAAMRVMRR